MLVSVIMPTYNCGRHIEEAIRSVIAQTQTDWELWLIDDCSSDNTEEIIKPYIEKYPNIHYFALLRHGGPAAARNEGIRRAGGRYIAFLDSDDMWKPEKLEKQIAFMQEKNAKFSCTAYARMDCDSELLKSICVPPEKISYESCLLLSNPIGNLTAMYDREFLGEFEVPDIERRNDFALWLQILKRADYCYGMKEVLAVYRSSRNGSVSDHKFGLAKHHWRLYHRIESHSILRSIFEMICWVIVKGIGIGAGEKKIR